MFKMMTGVTTLHVPYRGQGPALADARIHRVYQGWQAARARSNHHDARLIELNGDDLRRDPLEVHKATLASIVAKVRPGVRFNEHIEGNGETVFRHACKMGLEGIVSKRKDSAYRSGTLA